jgi:hypothetical protein
MVQRTPSKAASAKVQAKLPQKALKPGKAAVWLPNMGILTHNLPSELVLCST